MNAKTRENAALLCSAAASNPRNALFVFESIGFDWAAITLVERALSKAAICALCRADRLSDCRTRWAEAEAMIRTGWAP